MRTVKRRISRLEGRFAPPQDKEPSLIAVVNRVDRELALDNDACIQILREGGFLRGPSVRIVKLDHVPSGLNAGDLEKFLREDGLPGHVNWRKPVGLRMTRISRLSLKNCFRYCGTSFALRRPTRLLICLFIAKRVTPTV